MTKMTTDCLAWAALGTRLQTLAKHKVPTSDTLNDFVALRNMAADHKWAQMFVLTTPEEPMRKLLEFMENCFESGTDGLRVPYEAVFALEFLGEKIEQHGQTLHELAATIQQLRTAARTKLAQKESLTALYLAVTTLCDSDKEKYQGTLPAMAELIVSINHDDQPAKVDQGQVSELRSAATLLEQSLQKMTA